MELKDAKAQIGGRAFIKGNMNAVELLMAASAGQSATAVRPIWLRAGVPPGDTLTTPVSTSGPASDDQRAMSASGMSGPQTTVSTETERRWASTSRTRSVKAGGEASRVSSASASSIRIAEVVDTQPLDVANETARPRVRPASASEAAAEMPSSKASGCQSAAAVSSRITWWDRRVSSNWRTIS